MVITNSFSKLVYTTPRKFDELVKSRKNVEVGAERIYDFAHSKTSHRPAYSQYANTCSIFKINQCCGHIDPNEFSPKFIENLTDAIKKEKDKSDVVSGFVLGGKLGNPESEQLAYEIGNTMDKEGVDFSMMILKDKNTTPKGLDSMFHKGDNIYFTQEYNPTLEKEIANEVKNNPNPSKDKLEGIYSKYWNYIELSPNHQLEVEL